MTKHRLVWRQNRATPIVVKQGQRVRPPKKGEGRVVAGRPARAGEEKQIAAGRWVLTRRPGHAGEKSKVRPKLARKQKNRKPD